MTELTGILAPETVPSSLPTKGTAAHPKQYLLDTRHETIQLTLPIGTKDSFRAKTRPNPTPDFAILSIQ